MIGKDKETMEEMQTLLVAEVIMALSVLHSVISSHDTNDRFVKAMGEL
jgi:hypothetical protein